MILLLGEPAQTNRTYAFLPRIACSQPRYLALIQFRGHNGKTVHTSLSNMAINHGTAFEDRFAITRNENKASVPSNERLQRKISNGALNNLDTHRNFAESAEHLLGRQVILYRTEFLFRPI